MTITDPAAIKYANESFRPAADKLARTYYQLVQLNDQWNALNGTNDEIFALLKPEIMRVANIVSQTFKFVFFANKVYDALSLAPLFPNDVGELLQDADSTRPPVTGQDLSRLKNRMEEFQHWLDAAQFVNDSGVTLPIDFAFFNDILRLTDEGSKDPTTN